MTVDWYTLPTSYQTTMLSGSTFIRPRSTGLRPLILAFSAGLLLGVPITLCLDAAFRTADGFGNEVDFNSPIQISEPPRYNPTDNDRTFGGNSSRAEHSTGKRIVFRPGNVPGRKKNRPAKVQKRTLDFESLVDGVFWSEFAESLVPKGFVARDDLEWHRYLNVTPVLGLEEGCGRMQNRLLKLAGGGRACARYRHNSDQIQGEIFSFHLGRLLGLQNLPPSALALPDPRERLWSAAARNLITARWTTQHPAVLTRFVDDLRPAPVPRPFRGLRRRLRPVREDLGDNATVHEVVELVQWSDLILFDYLTANQDRVVNNLHNERWNPGSMSGPAHNLAVRPDGLLLFLDNESGLVHGYRLLDRYERLHASLLDALCVFRRRTVDALYALRGQIRVRLERALAHSDPGVSPDFLPPLPDANAKILEERMTRVLTRVELCRTHFEVR